MHGQRIEIGEIENAVENFDGIRRAAVRLTGESPHEMLAAYYTVSQDISETELRRYLSDRLPYYMVPSLFMKLENMPENANGKLNYRALPTIAPPKQEYIAPETDCEKLLCEIFAEVLKTKTPIGVNDNFLMLGADSINGMVAASRLRKRGYTFEIRYLFSAPTARLLAPLLVPVTEEKLTDNDTLPELTAEQRDAIEKNVGWDNVECFYPVMPVVNEWLNNRLTVMMYLLYKIEATKITPENFKLRVEDLITKHQALRSVFLCSTDGENFQVVLSEHKPNYFCIDLRALSEGDDLSQRQKDYFRTLIQLDLNRPKDLEREVLFRIGLICISEAKSILFFAFSHLLLDGTGIAQVVRELFEQAEIQSDREIWRKRLFRLYHEDYTESLKYWQKLLEGCRGFTPLPLKQGNIKQVSPEGFHVVGGKKLYEQIALRIASDNNRHVYTLRVW